MKYTPNISFYTYDQTYLYNFTILPAIQKINASLTIFYFDKHIFIRPMISGLKFLYFLNLFNNVDLNVIMIYIIWCIHYRNGIHVKIIHIITFTSWSSDWRPVVFVWNRPNKALPSVSELWIKTSWRYLRVFSISTQTSAWWEYGGRVRRNDTWMF